MLRARDEMDRRYAEPLDVPTLAAIAHLSASQFGRVFKEVFGETPHRYLQRRRVERAMTLLRQTDRPVTDVAWDVGFASLGTFSRTFSNIVGCSPTEFRAQHAPYTCRLLHRGVDAPASGTVGFGEAGHARRWLTSSRMNTNHITASTSAACPCSTRTRHSTSTRPTSASRSATTSTSASCAGSPSASPARTPRCSSSWSAGRSTTSRPPPRCASSSPRARWAGVFLRQQRRPRDLRRPP